MRGRGARAHGERKASGESSVAPMSRRSKVVRLSEHRRCRVEVDGPRTSTTWYLAHRSSHDTVTPVPPVRFTSGFVCTSGVKTPSPCSSCPNGVEEVEQMRTVELKQAALCNGADGRDLSDRVSRRKTRPCRPRSFVPSVTMTSRGPMDGRGRNGHLDEQRRRARRRRLRRRDAGAEVDRRRRRPTSYRSR